MYFSARILLCLFLVLRVDNLPAQDLQFSRNITPFDFQNISGQSFDLPFLGGYNVPRIQFVDMDLDGDPDLFLQEIDDRLSYFENIGTQSDHQFIWKTDDWLGITHGAWFRFIDIDNDNDFDLFCQGSGTRIRYLQNQGGNFITITDSLKDIEGNLIYCELTSIPEFYDLDCDGDKDFFLGRQSGTITHYENLNSNPDSLPEFSFITDSFQDILIIGGAALAKSNKHGANSLAFGDLNNDEASELLYGDFFSRSVYYFLNQGTCSNTELSRTLDNFPPADPMLSGGFNRPQLVDIDNDNDLDLFVTVLGGFYSFTQNIIENFYYYENNGSVENANFSKVFSTFLNQIDVGEESVPTFMDIDGDGDQDLFIGNQSEPLSSSTRGQLIYCENIGDKENPHFRVKDRDYILLENMYNFAPTFGDLDGDGDYDLLSGRNNGKIAYWENTGDKNTPQFELISSTYYEIDVGAISVPSLVDLDMDNDLDLIIGEFSGNLNYYINSGDSTNPIFELEDDFFEDILTSDYAKPSFSDFDSDGDADLVLGSGTGEIIFFQNDWNGIEFSFAQIENLNLKAQPKSSPTMVDLYNNNQPDLISGSQGGGLYYFENTSISSIDDLHASLPLSFFVSKSYPNPFNNRIVFNVRIPFESQLKIEIYNTAGQKIKSIVNNKVRGGTHTFKWNGNSDHGTSVSSGVYILQVLSGSFSHFQKIVLIK